MRKILIVEDDRELKEGICYALQKAGYLTESADSVQNAKTLFLKEGADVILLDVNLPDGEGFDFCKWVYGLLGVDRGVPEVWGSVYDIRELLDSSVKLMDGKSPLEISLPGPLNVLKKPLLRVVKGTVVEKVLRDHDVIKEGML